MALPEPNFLKTLDAVLMLIATKALDASKQDQLANASGRTQSPAMATICSTLESQLMSKFLSMTTAQKSFGAVSGLEEAAAGPTVARLLTAAMEMVLACQAEASCNLPPRLKSLW